jgi:hypothetical protein
VRDQPVAHFLRVRMVDWRVKLLSFDRHGQQRYAVNEPGVTVRFSRMLLCCGNHSCMSLAIMVVEIP